MPNDRHNTMTRVREMAVFGLRKAFVTPAPKPVRVNARMQGFFGPGMDRSAQWLPE